MNLNRHGREYYQLEITTDPVTAPTAWEGSFDGGGTWIAALSVSGRAAWLVEGAAAPPPVQGQVVVDTVQPLVRLTDNPEVIVRDAPRIYVS